MDRRDQARTTLGVALSAILAGSVVVDLLFFTGFIASDDVVYITAARRLAETGTLWPDPAPHEARLLMIGWCALLGVLVRQDVQAIAASFVLFHQLLNVLTFALARQLRGPPAGLLAAVLSATFPLLVVFSTTILPDIPMTVFFVAAFLAFRSAYVHGPDDRWSPLLLAISGGSLGLACLAKESGLVPLPFFLALAFVYERRTGATARRRSDAVIRAAGFLGGLALVLGMEVLVLRALTGSWLFRLGSLRGGGHAGAPSLAALGQRAMLLAETVGALSMPKAAVLLILLVAVFSMARAPGLRPMLLFPAWYAAYYTWGTASFTSYYSPRLQIRYFIPCVPFLLATLSACLCDAYGLVAQHARRLSSRPERPMRMVGAIALAAAVIVELALSDREAGTLYGAPLVTQSLRALRSVGSSGPLPVVISDALGAQLFPLLRRRPEGLLFSHEVGPARLAGWRSEGGFHFVDLHPTSPLRSAELNPLLGWPHGLPASEHHVESLVESLLSGRATGGWIMRAVGRFDLVGPRSTELRVFFGESEALRGLQHRPDRAVLVYQVTPADHDVRYPLSALDPSEAPPPVVNGGFERWSEAGPVGWRSRDSLAARTRGPEGDGAVRIGPGAFSYLWQSLPTRASVAGRRLVLRARVRSDTPLAARLWIRIAVGSSWDEAFGEPHPGDGNWKPLEAVLPVPPTSAGAEARIVLLHAGTQGHSEFADVELSVR